MTQIISLNEYLTEKKQERIDFAKFHNTIITIDPSLDNFHTSGDIKEYKRLVKQLYKGNPYAKEILSNKNNVNTMRNRKPKPILRRRIINPQRRPQPQPQPRPIPQPQPQPGPATILNIERHMLSGGGGRSNFTPTDLPYITPRPRQTPRPRSVYTAKVIYYREINANEFGKIYGNKLLRRNGKLYSQSYVTTINAGPEILKYADKRTYLDTNPNGLNNLMNIVNRHENGIRAIRAGDEDENDEEGWNANHDLYSSGLNRVHYVDIIVVTGVQRVGTGDSSFNPMSQSLHNSIGETSMYNKFITYDLNKAAKTFGEIFKINISDEMQPNMKANSCFINLIVRLYAHQIKKQTRGWKEFVDDKGRFQMKKLYELLKVTDPDQDLGLTIDQSLNFFKKFSINLRIWDVFGVVHKEYLVPTRTKKLSPSTLNILVYNNHVYDFDSKDKSKIAHISQAVEKCRENDKQIIDELMPTNRYYIPEFKQDEGIGLYYVNTLDDMRKIIFKLPLNEKAWLRFVVERDLDQVLFEMLDQKYVPKIKYAGGRIISLMFQVNRIVASIQNSFSECPEDTEITLENKNVYLNYHNAFHKFYHRVVDKHYLSQYPEHVLKVENIYSLRPCSGYFFNRKRDQTAKYNSLDVRKAYTSCMTNIDQIPVFGYFDYYKEYDNHEIEDLTMYIIKIHIMPETKKVKGTRIKKELLSILFPHTVSRVYGFKLKAVKSFLDTIYYEIRYYRRPSSIYNVDYKNAIDELYQTKIHETSDVDKTLKKYIVNLTTGLLEKKYNKQAHCFAFRDSNEAFYYKLRYGGTIYSKARPMGVDEEGKHIYDNNDTLSLLVVKKEKELCEGMRAVKEMIYESMSLKLYTMYNELVKNNIRPIGIKTDAILVNVSVETLKRYFNDADVIGGYKFETDKVCVNSVIKQRKINLNIDDFKRMKPIQLSIKDEYDIKEISKIYNENNNIIALGEYPGVGKTSSFINYQKETKVKILFATPYNKLAQALKKTSGCDCITVDKLLGTRPDARERNQVVNGSMPYPIEEYDMVVFDEVGLHGPSKLKSIAKYIESYKGKKKFAATMDCDQLPPIEQLNNVGEDPVKIKAYHMSCIYQIFSKKVVYTIPKRIRTDEERQILYKLKTDVFSDMSVVDIIKKYNFNSISELKFLKTKQNVCYFKYRTDIVNRYVHNTLISVPPKGALIEAGGVRYWPGLYLLCKEYYKNDGYEIRTNYEYKIQKISTKTFTILNEQDNTQTTLDTQMIMKKFKLPYANTCHCVQGLSISEPMTIFDANTPYAQREYVWTAITRATKLSDITFFVHPESEVQSLTQSKKKQYLKFKVDRYKGQDSKAGRTYNEKDYIDAEWIMSEMEKTHNFKCPKCSTPFEIELQPNEYGTRSNMTVDRKDNTKAHIKSNCSLLCNRCNVTKRDDGPGMVLHKALKNVPKPEVQKQKKIMKQETEFNYQIDTFNQLFDM